MVSPEPPNRLRHGMPCRYAHSDLVQAGTIAYIKSGCMRHPPVDAKQSGKVARVKQREWRKHRVDTIEAAPAIAVPGFHPGLFSAAPIGSELSHQPALTSRQILTCKTGVWGTGLSCAAAVTLRFSWVRPLYAVDANKEESSRG
jgi:hypothetical protein